MERAIGRSPRASWILRGDTTQHDWSAGSQPRAVGATVLASERKETPMRQCTLALALALMTVVLHAQDDDHAPLPAPVGGRQPTKAQLAAQLEKLKTDLLPKVMSEKVAGNEELRKKWLAAWRPIISPHYAIFTNGPVTCKKYADTLEELYAAVKKELPFVDRENLLQAIIFADEEEYFRFTVQVTGWSEEEARGTAGHATGSYYA